MTDMEALEPARGAAARRGIAAYLLANVAGLADDMLTYLVERIPEAGADADGLRSAIWSVFSQRNTVRFYTLATNNIERLRGSQQSNNE